MQITSPKMARVDLVKRSRGMYRNFAKDEKCKFGDKCMFQHTKENPDNNNAEMDTEELGPKDFEFREALNFEPDLNNT